MNESTGSDGLNVPAFTLVVSYAVSITTIMAAIIIFGIAAGIAFINTVGKPLFNQPVCRLGTIPCNAEGNE